jgi:hypothetical protein
MAQIIRFKFSTGEKCKVIGPLVEEYCRKAPPVNSG